VAYAFYAGRTLRWAWGAYGLVILPPLVAVLIFKGSEARRVFLIILALVGLVGLYGWWTRAGRKDYPGKTSFTERVS
jgi:hypothetical protein